MSTFGKDATFLPPEQQAILDKCFHPTGTFIKFQREDIEQSIPDRFEQQVRRFPDRLAIKTRTEQLTFCELKKAANRIARAILSQLGEGPEPIALLLTQWSPVIAAMLGILKSGKFFVLVDSSMPQARVSHILEDSQARLIVTTKRDLALSSGFESQVVIIDDLEGSLSGQNPGVYIAPDATAYLTYTSGSTGLAKGVMENHRNQLFRTMTRTNVWHICSEDRWSLFSFGTAQMIKIMCNVLLNGAGLYPIDIKEEGVAPLANWLVQEKITLCQLTTMLFRHFIDTLMGGEEFPHLRLLKVGGQTVTSADVELYKKHFSPNCVMAHGLASTETGEVVNYFIDKTTDIADGPLPLGYAIPDTEVMLLDDDGQRLEWGSMGEIAIRSRYLSPGYWCRPDLTEAAYLPDPEGGEQRIYLTGDLGRMLSDGCLTLLGRKDFQTKVRGYRVEVAEVETALLKASGVKEAVVLSQEDRTGNSRLVAYLVPVGQSAPMGSDLRKSLEAELPHYMVPSAFVFLEALPLLPTGKVDRRALPAPGTARPELHSAFVGPRTPVEDTLGEIWAEVLNIEQVGIHDNFLDLGGNSLLASQVISRVIETFRVELPLRSLFEAPTIAEMCVALIQGQVRKADQHDIERMLSELESLPEASI